MSKDYEVVLPKLGESIMNATIVQWFKKEGDLIKKDEPLLEVSTDKVNSEIPAPVSGILKKIHAKPEEELNVGDLLAQISLEEDATSPSETTEKRVPTQTPLSSDEQKDVYSPAVLRLARENNLSLDELQKIQGTGTGGRVTKQDLENYILSQSKTHQPQPISSSEGDVEYIEMKGLRKAIADNIARSFYQAPHASLICEVDVTDIMNLIEREKEAFFKKHGYKLSITSFIARAIVVALKKYPLLNSSLEKDTIIVKHFIHLGIAVSIEGGVIVPVIKHIDKLSLREIAQKVSDFANKARTQTLEPDDVKEGTVTMTNFGMTGIEIGIPIIVFPQVAIVGIGGISKKVVAREDDTFGVRKVMNISLTFDHRVVDGMYGCGFLTEIKKHLQHDLNLD